MPSFLRSIPALALLASATYSLATEPVSATPKTIAVPSGQRARVVEGYGKLPLSFEPNQGQADPQVKFLSRGDGYSLSLTPSEAVLSLHGKSCSQRPEMNAMEHLKKEPQPCAASPDSVLRMTMLGSNPSAEIQGEAELPGKSNYFIGKDPSTWHTNISNYRKVQYRNVYPGIDLVYYGNQRQLEHDFIVAPGADPKSIRLNFTGTKRLSIERDGTLKLYSSGGVTQLKKPEIYQESGGRRKLIAGRYERKSDKEVAFAIGVYDHSQKLIIDPVLVYSTYLGGSGYDDLRGIAVDSEGNAYVAGTTSSVDFPLSNPLFSYRLDPNTNVSQIFISKISSDGSTLIYSSYLGSATGYMEFGGITLDEGENIYVTGLTGADDFPVVNAFQSKLLGGFSAFVTKLNAPGSALEYSTYLSGESGASGSAIAVDKAGAAYVAGVVRTIRLSNGQVESDFPTVNPFSTVGGLFVSKMSPAGSSLEYSTLLGETRSNLTYTTAIAVDPLGEAMITGHIDSPDFPLRNPLPNSGGETFATKLNASGSDLIFSTLLNGTLAGGIATNAAGDAFVTGGNDSGAFVTRIKAQGSAAVYSQSLGNSDTGGLAIAVDSDSNAYLTGFTTGGLPLVNPVQSVTRGNYDAFLAKVDPTGSTLLYSTYFGGSKGDDGSGIAIDGKGNVYMSGGTYSSDFPTKAALQPKPPNGKTTLTGFVVKISERAPKFSVTNTVDKGLVGPGGDLHYTVTITNTDSSVGSGLLTVTSTRDRFRTCTVSNGDPCRFVVLGGRATVNISSLAPGESRTIAIYATAAKTAGDYNLIPNTATVSTGPPLNETYSATATTTVRQTADIAIASFLVDSTNGLLHYVHTVTNLGPDNAHAVLLLDSLPANSTYVSATTTAGECSFKPTIGPNGSVRCPLNNPVAGGTVTVNVVLQAIRDACPSVTNTTTITSQSIDSEGVNDSATVTAPLPAAFCTLPPPPVLSYSLSVYNDLRTQAQALNNHGDLLDTYEYSYLFKSGRYNPIALPFRGSFAFNDHAQVVGQTAIDNKQVIQIYDSGSVQSLDFGPRPSNVAVVPVAISNSGTIAGYETWVYSDAQHPKYQQSFIYKNGTTKNIFPSGVFSRALNAKDEVAGDGNGLALLYSHGMVVSSFRPQGAYSFYVSALDSSGRVGGFYYTTRSKEFNGYIYSGGHFLDLGKAFGPNIIVQGMNDCGELVGKEDLYHKGFIYTHGRFVGLNDLVDAPPGYFLQPLQINNRGVIFGLLLNPRVGGSGGTFLLTPSVLEKCGSDATIDNEPASATTAAGGNITYNIKVKNLDTATAQFTVSDELDGTTTLVSCGVTGGGGSCTGSPGSHILSAVLTNLPKGSAATIAVTVKAASTYTAGTVIMNTATLSSTLTSDYLSTAYTSVP